MTKHRQVMVSQLMFYFRRVLFDCLKYTKEDNLLKTFASAVILKSAKEFRFLAFIKINIYTIEKHSLSGLCAKGFVRSCVRLLVFYANIPQRFASPRRY